MPTNAANRMVIQLSQGVVPTFSINGGKRNASGTAHIKRQIGLSSSFTVQFQTSDVAFKGFYDWAGSPDAGTFRFKVGAVETANIAYNATAAVVKAALVALVALEPYVVEVAGSAAGSGYTVTLRAKPGTQPGEGGISTPRPLADDFLTVSTNAVTASSVVQAVTTTVQTWRNTDPDGYNAPIPVKGEANVAFGGGADENASNNSLGPWFRIVSTGVGGATCELSLNAQSLDITRI